MRFEDNFVVLTESRMVDLVLKVTVQAGRFELDDCTRGFEIEFDPDLRPDRLWQKMPEEDIQRLIKFDMPRRKDDLIPFRSKTIVGLASFGIREKPIDDDLILKLQWSDKSFLLYRRLITERTPKPLSDHPVELIEYVIRSMPKWYGVKATTPCGWKDMKRLTFLIDKSFARHLPGYEAQAFEEDGAGNIVFDKREIV